MAIHASKIIGVESIDTHRTQKKATVQGLARIESPPDMQPLTTALQTTLDVNELLAIFLHEVDGLLSLRGLRYRHPQTGLILQQGAEARHSASYSLSLQDEELGEITALRSQPFAEQDLALLEHLLCPLLYPLRNALRYHSALAGAFVDPLTQVGNRSALDKALPREVELAHRNHLPLSLLVGDLDLFKRINDDHGHLAGDCVLRGSTARIQTCLRGSDQIFRYGGEEFVMVLPGTDRDGALLVAERIRHAVASSPYSCEGKLLSATISIGVALLTVEDDGNSLFDKADKALYRAKSEGRDRVCL